MSFAIDIGNFVRKVGSNQERLVRALVIEMGTRVVMRTPVGDPSKWAGPAPKGYAGGRARANWQYGQGVAPEGVLDAHDPSGNATIAKLAGKVGMQKAAGRVHYITNNLPYIMRLETGWSKQAPAGMVGITVREFDSALTKLAKEIGT